MAERIWVIIPTYNEIENLAGIIGGVAAELQRLAPEDHRILVVDDDSPDGTGRLADELAETTDSLEVLHRPEKDGLGRAYIVGFERALDRGAEILVQMDADFSHHPRYLEPLLAAAETSDLVIGSRYVPGGAVEDWGLARRAISRGGSAYARRILGIHVRDLTGGFKCVHRRVLEAIDLTTLRAAGYVFQVEVTYRTVRAGFTVTEVPILFADRSAGASKMSWRIALEAMLLVPRLRHWSRKPQVEPLLRA